LALILSPGITRIVRSAVMAIRPLGFIEAATAAGGSKQRIMVRHVLPNIVSPLLVIVTVNMAVAILIEAALAYLGLGTSPTRPSWGGMLSDPSVQLYAIEAWWIAVFPGVAIMLTVVCLNLLGDALRDHSDPRL